MKIHPSLNVAVASLNSTRHATCLLPHATFNFNFNLKLELATSNSQLEAAAVHLEDA